MAGVTIGDGAVIAAGSVVTKGCIPLCYCWREPSQVDSYRIADAN